MNVLSLFDGISCGRLALERAGRHVDNYFAYEIDPWALRVSRYNWPDINHLGDVTTWQNTCEGWPKIGLILAGSPCQGFSFAGKQLAFDDPRSKLFFTFVDILRWVQANNNPNVRFLLENVKMRKDHLQTITDHVGVEPIFINSTLVSAQNRQRYYWLNWKVEQPTDKGIMLKDILESDATGWIKNRGYWYKRNDKSQCLDANYWKGVDNHGQRTMALRNERYGMLTPIECERLQTLPDNYTNAPRISKTQRYKMLGNAWTVDVISHLLK